MPKIKIVQPLEPKIFVPEECHPGFSPQIWQGIDVGVERVCDGLLAEQALPSRNTFVIFSVSGGNGPEEEWQDGYKGAR